MTGPPPRLAPARPHRGALTDPARWAAYRHRPGDVIISTPPKCGTTWTQAITAMVIRGGSDLPDMLSTLSPWFDAKMPGSAGTQSALEHMVATLEAQTHRRCIKTHTPADGLPLYGTARFIAVYRNPIDVFFSLRKHMENRADAGAGRRLLQDTGDAFREWVGRAFDPDDCDTDSLNSITAHYESFTRPGHVPNLLVLHYADMAADPAAAVDRIADHLGVALTGAQRAEITQATGFDAMTANAARYVPFGGSGFWKNDGAFFSGARRGGDHRLLSGDDLAFYRSRLASLVAPDAARWLEHGSG